MNSRRTLHCIALAGASVLAVAPWGSASAQEGEPIRIGVLTALSGPYVPFGQPLYDGVKLAVDEINAEGGLEVNGTRHPVEVVERDTRSDVNTTVAGALSLVRDEGVKYIVGPATGIETQAAMEITQPASVIELSAASVLQGVLTPENTGPNGDRRHLFMTQTSSEVREATTIQASAETFGNPTSHALIISNDSNGDFIGKKVVEAIEDQGYSMALPTVLYEPGTTDYSSYLTSIRAANPDHLNIWWLPTDGINILQQARQLETSDSYFVYGIEPIDVTSRLGDGVSGVLIACSPICRSITTTEASTEFWAKYQALIGEGQQFGSAAGGAAWYYEGTRMLFKAIQATGSIDDTDAIAAELAVTTISGPLGDLSFDDRHVFRHGYDFCHFDGGEPDCRYIAPAN